MSSGVVSQAAASFSLADEMRRAQGPAAAAGYTLRLLGDRVLGGATENVGPSTMQRGLVWAMQRIMRDLRGIGISANQVGSNLRVCIVTLDGFERLLINPRITRRSDRMMRCAYEGCLSVPRFRTNTLRHFEVTVAYRDETWLLKEMTVHGRDAQVVQHELDHLDGRTIVDGLSRQQRRQAERLVAKECGR